MKKYNSGNTNTILIVIVLIIIVAFGVWYYTMKKAPANNGGTNVDVNLPASAGDTVPTGTEGGNLYQ